jgi:hypothetical protein
MVTEDICRSCSVHNEWKRLPISIRNCGTVLCFSSWKWKIDLSLHLLSAISLSSISQNLILWLHFLGKILVLLRSSNVLVRSPNLLVRLSNLLLPSSNLPIRSLNLLLRSSNFILHSSNLLLRSSNMLLRSSNLLLPSSNLFLRFSNMLLCSSNLLLSSSNLLLRTSNLVSGASNTVYITIHNVFDLKYEFRNIVPLDERSACHNSYIWLLRRLFVLTHMFATIGCRNSQFFPSQIPKSRKFLSLPGTNLRSSQCQDCQSLHEYERHHKRR